MQAEKYAAAGSGLDFNACFNCVYTEEMVTACCCCYCEYKLV